MDTKRKRSTALLSLLLLACLSFTAGCPDLPTAAKLMKSYRLSLGAFQDTETAAYQKGFISPTQHVHDQSDVEKLANFGIIADKALLASDKTTITQDVANALAVVSEIEANDVTSIGDQTTRAAVEVAVAGLQNLLMQVQLSLGVKQ